ncbi:MAG TPA: LytTR family DNA-binding domain-containing protein [Pyrinomonadaceae bacterium]
MDSSKQKVRTLIVDDESLARRTLRGLLLADPEIEVIGECRSGSEAVAFIRKQTPDLLFLDIQMPGMSGFETLSQIGVENIPAIVFVTAYDKYALKAFEVHAIDYLLKPFTDERFAAALNQAKMQVQMKEVNRVSRGLVALLAQQAKSEPVLSKRRFLTRFMIQSGGRAAFIKATDVDWIGADDYYIKLHVNGKTHLLRMSLNELEEKLDPEQFLRIHRSAIVNFERVKELQQSANNEWVVLLKDGTELKLSRSRRERLKQFLTGEHEDG